MLDSNKDSIRKLDPHFLSHEDDTNHVMVEHDIENETDNKILEERFLKEEEGKKLMNSPKEDIDLHRKELQFNDENADCITRSSRNKARNATQILAVIAVSFGAYIYGTAIVFPAVAIPSLIKSNKAYWTSKEESPNCTLSESNVSFTSHSNSTEAYLPFMITEGDLSLIASIASLGMLLGCLVAGPSSNYIGRKWTYILGVCGSLGIGYALIAAAQNRGMLFLGRFLHGSGLGVATTIATVYTMEIATPNLRGRLAVIPAIAGTLGILTTHCIGAVCNWQWLSIICGSFNLPLLIALLFIPESPVYLISKDQIDQAHKVLRILRGPNWNVTEELTDIKVAFEKSKANRRTVKLKDFFCRELRSKAVWKPFVIALILMFFFQYTGINIVLLYTPDIFKMSDPSSNFINEFKATILVGIALLVSNIGTLLVADKMWRRLMLILSAFGVTVSMIGIGAFLHLVSLERLECEINGNATTDATNILSFNDTCKNTSITESDFFNSEDCPKIHTEGIGWLPLLLLMLYIFFFNLGYGAMIWITAVEILPQHVRTVATSLTVAVTCICSFVTSHTYNDLKHAMTGHGVFYLYGIVSFLGLLFIILFIPETKGKTEAEIQEYFDEESSSCPGLVTRKSRRKEAAKRKRNQNE